MHRLIVNPGTENAWEIPLAPGVITLGRNPENTFSIEHPSVSGRHCEVSVTDSGVAVKDLGSSNGTTVNGAPVAEAPLSHGQIIRLGDVALQYEHEPPRATRIAPVSAALPSGAAHCKIHPQVAATFVCPKCQRTFCNSCVSSRQGRTFCRACGVECAALEPAPVQTEPASFPRQVRGAFSYPLKGDGVILLVCGGVLFLLIDAAKYVLRFMPGYGWVLLLLLTVSGTGYLTAYLQRILTSSARNEKNMPDWPDITDFWSDTASPFFQLIGTVAFCFAPAIGLTIYAFSATEGEPWLGWAMTASLLFGSVYFPMAFMAVTMFDSVAGVNPLLIIPSIVKIPKEYLLTIILFIVVLIVRWFGQRILPELVPIPILPSIFASFLGLYLLAVEMRILGLLYWTKRVELGWFPS